MTAQVISEEIYLPNAQETEDIFTFCALVEDAQRMMLEELIKTRRIEFIVFLINSMDISLDENIRLKAHYRYEEGHITTEQYEHANTLADRYQQLKAARHGIAVGCLS